MDILNVFRKIAAGMVTGKNHYAASGINRETLTSINKGQDEVAIFTQAPATTESWSLVVKGTDKSGRHLLTKEIYVDQTDWNNTVIGDKYPPRSKS